MSSSKSLPEPLSPSFAWRSLLDHATEAGTYHILQTQWPAVVDSEDDAELSGLACLIIVYRNILRFALNIENGIPDMQSLEHVLGETDAALWQYLWCDFSHVPEDSQHFLEKTADMFSMVASVRFSSMPRFSFKSLSRTLLKEFCKLEFFQLYDTRCKHGSGPWTHLADGAHPPSEIAGIVDSLPRVLEWDGVGDLGESVAKYFNLKILSRSEDLELKLSIRCKMAPVLRILYKSAKEVSKMHEQLQYFEFNLGGVYNPECNVVGYRLLAAVRLRGREDEADSMRVFDDTGRLVRPAAKTPLYPVQWSVSESNREFTLCYVRVVEEKRGYFRSRRTHHEVPDDSAPYFSRCASSTADADASSGLEGTPPGAGGSLNRGKDARNMRCG